MFAFLSPSGFFWVCSMCTASLIWLAIPGTLQSSAIISLVRTCADGTICALLCARLHVDAALVVLCLCVQAFACCARLLTCLRQALAVAAQEIYLPDDQLLRDVLAKHFADKQCAVTAQVLDYIVNRMERSFAAAQKIAADIDELALARKTPVNLSIARQVLDRHEPKLI